MAATTFQFHNPHHDHSGASVWDQWYLDGSANPMMPMPMPNFWQASGLPFEQPMPVTSELPKGVSPSSFINPVSLHSVSSPGTDPASVAESDEHFEIHNKHTKRRKTSSTLKSSPKPVDSPPCSQDSPGRRKSVTEPVRRERNRTAAAKCRAKSKVAEEDLKEMQRVQRERNRVLRAQFEELTNETLMLKHELLNHSDCSHPVIDKYLMREADKISRGYNATPESSRSSISMRD